MAWEQVRSQLVGRKSWQSKLSLAALCCLLALAAQPATNASASALSWSAPRLVSAPPQRAANTQNIACPSTSLCLAGDEEGNILASTNPTGGAGAWHVTNVDSDNKITAISCPSTSFCIAGDSHGNVLTTSEPTGPPSAWTTTHLPVEYGIATISCPSASFCVLGAAAYFGEIFTSNNPTGGVGAWSETTGISVSTISCPSTSLCVGGNTSGEVITSTNPTGGAGAWTKTSLLSSGESVASVSCPTSTFCAAVDEDQNYNNNESTVLTSTNPTGGNGAWNSTTIEGTTFLHTVSCRTATLCIAADERGDVYTSSNPTGGPSAWGAEVVNFAVTGISCPADSLCVTSGGINLMTSTHVTDANAGRWQAVTVSGGEWDTLESISCPSNSFCAAVDKEGNLLTSTNPTGGSAAWNEENIDGGNSLSSISCPSASFCTAADRQGNVLTSVDPTGGAGEWATAHVEEASYEIDSLTCQSSSLCVAWSHSNVHGNDHILTSTNPTGGVAAWEAGFPFFSGGSSSPPTIACPTASLCVAAGSGDIYTTSNPAGGAGSWTQARMWEKAGFSIFTEFTGVSCPSATFCVAVTDTGDVFTATNPTGGNAAWTGSGPLSEGFTSVSCATSTLCVGIAEYGGSEGVLTSTNPTGGAGAWNSGSVPLEGHSFGESATIACPSTTLCVGLGTHALKQAILTTTHPASISWSATAVKNSASQVWSLSCASASFCAASDDGGGIMTSSEPAASAGGWTRTQVEGHFLEAMSCASAGLCVASGTNENGSGRLFVSTNPTGGPAAWQSLEVEGMWWLLSDLSCPSTSLCVGVGQQGDVVTSANPTNAASWSLTNIDGSNTISGVSCPSASFCAAVDSAGNILTSTNPTGGSSAWHSTAGGTTYGRISCPSTSLCVVATTGYIGYGQILVSTNPTSVSPTWTPANIEPGGILSSVSCPSTGLCAVTDVAGKVFVSTEPTGGASAWVATKIDSPNGQNSLQSVSCPSSGFCEAIDRSGFVMAGVGNAQHSLNVVKDGSGAGAVTSSPAGISCGATCSHTYEGGTAISLTATPASGSVFTGWSGAGCSGTGSCLVTLNADTTVTATFSPNGGGSEEGGGTSGGGGGNPTPGGPAPPPTHPVRKPLKCHSGFKRVVKHGKARCVKVKKKKKHRR